MNIKYDIDCYMTVDDKEADIEAYLEARVVALGGICEKFTSPGKRGVPDRIVTLPYNRIFMVELKRPSGRYRKLQEIDHRERLQRGCAVETLWSKKEVDAFIRRVKG